MHFIDLIYLMKLLKTYISHFGVSCVQIHIGEVNVDVEGEISFVLHASVLTYHENIFSGDEVGDDVADLSAGLLSVLQTGAGFISFNLELHNHSID